MGLGHLFHEVTHPLVSFGEGVGHFFEHNWKTLVSVGASMLVFTGAFALLLPLLVLTGPFAPFLAAFAAGALSSVAAAYVRSWLDGRSKPSASAHTLVHRALIVGAIAV